MDSKTLNEFKTNIKQGLANMELVECENAGYEAYHWGITDGGDIGLYQCYDCGCIKHVGTINVPNGINVFEYENNDEEEVIEEILNEVDAEMGNHNMLMYLYKPAMHACSCDECEEYDEDYEEYDEEYEEEF